MLAFPALILFQFGLIDGIKGLSSRRNLCCNLEYRIGYRKRVFENIYQVSSSINLKLESLILRISGLDEFWPRAKIAIFDILAAQKWRLKKCSRQIIRAVRNI